MCGIIGYIGKQKALPIILGGLKALEYRGYDSAGVAVCNQGNVVCIKNEGEVRGLIGKVSKANSEGNLGIGHCLHPNTIVQLSNGRTIFIKDARSYQGVLNLNVGNLEHGTGEILVTRHKSPAFLYEVKTPISSFFATGEHKTLVYSKERGIYVKRVRDLAKGDYLPFPNKIDIKETRPIKFKNVFVKRYYAFTDPGLNFAKKQISTYSLSAIAAASGLSTSYLDHMKRNDRNFREDQLKLFYNFTDVDFNEVKKNHLEPVDTIHGKHIELPEYSSPRLMRILGYFIGDGYAGKKSLRFKDMERHTLEQYRKLIRDEFNVDGNIKTMSDTNAVILECNSRYLCDWLKENIVNRKNRFLSKIGELPKDQLAEFIGGLYDAEGYVAQKSKQIGLGITNEFLARSLQLWLLRFGIIASLRSEKPDTRYNKPNYSYRLLVSNKESALLFQKFIKLKSRAKAQKIDSLVETLGNKRFSFRSLAHSDDTLITKVMRVERVQSDTDYVYDLEVSSNSNFLANSIFTHNSRWATHGEPNETNAHPHHDCSKRIFLVHNGIIENYKELKSRLEKRNHSFYSETDTEVVAHLIEEFLREGHDFRSALFDTLKTIEGAYALAIMDKENPETLYAARLGSPLVVGIGENENLLASDPSALIGSTKNVVYLKDGEVAEITLSSVNITDLDDKPAPLDVEELEWDLEQARKGNFPHFMLKEIYEGPEVIQNAMRGRLLPEKNLIKLGGLELIEKKIRKIKRIIVLAAGTSYYAGLVGEYAFEEISGIPVEVQIASEFRYKKEPFEKGTAVLAISQSGETADTLAALRKAKEAGLLALGLVNVVGSSIARATDAGVYNHAGPEIGVASTKAFLSQITILTLMALYMAREKNDLYKNIIQELPNIPGKIEEVLEKAGEIEKIAEKYKKYRDFLFVGRRYNYPVALEGALKLKEISYLHAEGYGAGEMKHGPLAMIDKNFPTVAVVPQNSVSEKMYSNIEEIKARGGPVLAVATDGDDKMKNIADDVIYIPPTLEPLEPLLSVVPLQFLAYYIGIKLGYNVDKPRNLAKSVTVE